MSTLSLLKFRAGTIAAALAITPFSPARRAQDAGKLVQVNVPFAFDTASQHFDAGLYTIRTENEGILRFQGTSQSEVVMTWVEDNAQPAKTGKVMFQKYGDRYFLSEISIAGKSRNLYFWPSKAEQELQVAGNKTAPVGVELSLMDGSLLQPSAAN
jgi:hypothetical protein